MRKFTLFLTLFIAMTMTMVAQNYSLTETRLNSEELNAKTTSTLIAIKNLSLTNSYYYVGNTGAVPYSVADYCDAATFVWQPVTEGVAGSYYLMKPNGTYMQTSSPKDFGSIENAAVFTTTNPTSSGTNASHFNNDSDSQNFIDDESLLVRFVNSSAGNWINVQNGSAGTPLYNNGTGGWTIHYIYAVEAATDEPEPSYDNISDLADGTQATVKGTVVATYARGFLIQDATGTVLVYLNGAHEYVAGDVVTVNGTLTTYGGMIQFPKESVIEKTGETVTVEYPAATVMDGAALDAFLASPSIRYVEYTGTLTISGTYYNVAVEGATTAVGSIQYPNSGLVTAASGAKVKVTGYTIGVSSQKYVNTMATTVEVVEDAPVVELPKYTVTEALAAYVDGQATQAIVTGYIVGCVNNSPEAGSEFGADATVNTNILISDNAYTTDYTECLIVQLPKGDIRNALNLVDNPTNYRAQVVITGSIEKYFQVAGLKNPTAYELTGEVAPEPTPEPEPEYATEEAIAALTASTVKADELLSAAGFSATSTNLVAIDIAGNADAMLYSNAPCTNTQWGDQFQSWAVLFDGSSETIFHSEYDNGTGLTSIDGLDHYLRVDMGENNALSQFAFTFTTRNKNCTVNSPTTIVVEGSNEAEGEYTEIATITDIPQENSYVYTSDVLGSTDGPAYRYIRYRVTETGSNQTEGGGKIFFFISEFGMSKVETSDTPSISEEYADKLAEYTALYNANVAAKTVLAQEQPLAADVAVAAENLDAAIAATTPAPKPTEFDWTGTYTLTADVESLDGGSYPTEFDVEVIYDETSELYLITSFMGNDVTALNYGGIPMEVSEDGMSAEVSAMTFLGMIEAGSVYHVLFAEDYESLTIKLTRNNDDTISMGNFIVSTFNLGTGTGEDVAKYTNVTLVKKGAETPDTDAFTVVSVVPADGSEVESIKQIVVTLSHDVECTMLRPGIDTYNIICKDNGRVHEANFNIEGSVITFDLVNEIVDAGVHSLMLIGHGCFRRVSDGAELPEAEFTFNVTGKEIPTFKIESVTPAEGVVTEIRQIVVVPAVSSLAALPNNWTLTNENGEAIAFSIDWGIEMFRDIILTFSEPIKNAGTYTLTIPEGSIYDDNGAAVVATEYKWTITATSIDDINAQDGKMTIYDLTGRKIEKITKNGVYIINGKKTLVK